MAFLGSDHKMTSWPRRLFHLAKLKKVDVLLFASVGGHLDQLLDLSDTFGEYDYLIVVNDTPPSRKILESRTIQISHGERDLKQLLNLLECLIISCKTRPRVVLSTGAAPAVWFSLFGKMFGAKVVFVESIARVDRLSLTGRLVNLLANDFFVQWPDLASSTQTRFAGQIESKK